MDILNILQNILNISYAYIYPYIILVRELLINDIISTYVIGFFLNIFLLLFIRLIRGEKFYFFNILLIGILSVIATPFLIINLLYNIYNKLFFKLFGYNYPQDINPNYNYLELYKEDKIEKIRRIYND